MEWGPRGSETQRELLRSIADNSAIRLLSSSSRKARLKHCGTATESYAVHHSISAHIQCWDVPRCGDRSLTGCVLVGMYKGAVYKVC